MSCSNADICLYATSEAQLVFLHQTASLCCLGCTGEVKEVVSALYNVKRAQFGDVSVSTEKKIRPASLLKLQRSCPSLPLFRLSNRNFHSTTSEDIKGHTVY